MICVMMVGRWIELQSFLCTHKATIKLETQKRRLVVVEEKAPRRVGVPRIYPHLLFIFIQLQCNDIIVYITFKQYARRITLLRQTRKNFFHFPKIFYSVCVTHHVNIFVKIFLFWKGKFLFLVFVINQRGSAL